MSGMQRMKCRNNHGIISRPFIKTTYAKYTTVADTVNVDESEIELNKSSRSRSTLAVESSHFENMATNDAIRAWFETTR